FPGLVGGHCIGVDPYYLTYKSAKFGHHAQIINSGRGINDGMGAYVARQVTLKLSSRFPNLKDCRVLVMGATFKENVSDIRNSKVADVISELKEFGVQVDVVDPLASPEEIRKEYSFELSDSINGPYHGIVAAVNHEEYNRLDEAYFQSITHPGAVFADLKGTFRNRVTSLDYWSL
ncbi:MAG: nucleotide sugar dehydrogenase, partial [Bacteroidales bacterium]|nr:nucleotide sugar dehydrogenase [Bacteroidales bacterium]